jgi:hypothetical protein
MNASSRTNRAHHAGAKTRQHDAPDYKSITLRQKSLRTGLKLRRECPQKVDAARERVAMAQLELLDFSTKRFRRQSI